MTEAVFTRGSTMRHVLNMTGASSMGLLAMFGVDMVDMYFLALLGEQEIAAAVGFAGTLLFFVIAVSIGLQISVGALVARAEGAGQRLRAGRFCSSGILFNFAVSVLLTVCVLLNLEFLLRSLGASGITLEYALSFSRISLPNTPILMLGMACASVIRAVGDARRSMWATVLGSLVNGILDPIFIFTLGWGIEGAAWASVVARWVVFFTALYFLFGIHRLPVRISFAQFLADIRPIMQIAGPAVLTNLATPIGGSFVLITMAQFGDSAVAGAAIMGRITPMAFCAVFALSGAVGPIIGQNAGAGLYQRVRSTLANAMLFNTAYVLIMWAILWSCTELILQAFSASDMAAELISFYTHFLVGAFMFNGMLFIANAAFNNLHRPHWATAFNFGRALLGTIPAVYYGARWYGAKGVLAGEVVGALLFGIFAIIAAFMLVRRLEEQHRPLPEDELVPAVEGLETERTAPL